MRSRRSFLVLGLALAQVGCGAGTQAPPEAGYERGGVPDLTGAGVMVFPVQLGRETHPALDQELEYALGQSSQDVGWVFPDALRETLVRNPGTDLSVDDLPVRMFLAAEVERVGDPLFGQLYRLGAISDAAYALVPIAARAAPVEASAAQVDARAFIEVTAALVDARGGYVVWFGVVRGDEGVVGDISLAATVAEALARRIVR